MPYNIWCGGCHSMIAKGVRFNAEKKQVGNYYSTKVVFRGLFMLQSCLFGKPPNFSLFTQLPWSCCYFINPTKRVQRGWIDRRCLKGGCQVILGKFWKMQGIGILEFFRFKSVCMTIMNYMNSTTPCTERSYLHFHTI